tara:strand:- start:316 stop:777 length:462 start_codon:yes stop_codon:yes gene_type:complete
MASNRYFNGPGRYIRRLSAHDIENSTQGICAIEGALRTTKDFNAVNVTDRKMHDVKPIGTVWVSHFNAINQDKGVSGFRPPEINPGILPGSSTAGDINPGSPTQNILEEQATHELYLIPVKKGETASEIIEVRLHAMSHSYSSGKIPGMEMKT